MTAYLRACLDAALIAAMVLSITLPFLGAAMSAARDHVEWQRGEVAASTPESM